MDPKDRLQNMEEELTQNQMKTDAIETALQTILAKMSVKLAKVKPATPVDFDGDQEKGHAFFNTCSIYFAIVGDLFPNNQAQIHWASSFFKSDCAAHFQGDLTRSKGQGKRKWDAFEKTFSDQFCLKNEQLTALTKLEGTSWYQAKDPEYDDDKTIVIKFRRGLDPTLQNQ
ncbi:hypothetical protein JB92DRAFT_2939053, partial [Gautieria morchelliformis]